MAPNDTTPATRPTESVDDLFHRRVSDRDLVRVFTEMALTPRLAYKVSTTRHRRMRTVVNSTEFRAEVRTLVRERQPDILTGARWQWPLPNVWLGATISTQDEANAALPTLLDTVATVRWLNIQGLSTPIDLPEALKRWTPSTAPDQHRLPAGEVLHWIVAAGGRRPMHPDWIRTLRDHATAAGIAFNFTGWGRWEPTQRPGDDDATAFVERETGRRATDHDLWHISSGHWWGTRRVEAHQVVRTIDGRTWDDHPSGHDRHIALVEF
ncbi:MULTISPECIES: DUF5131 family protein [Mycolicibacterium]|uniref:Bacteriophage protein n=1 Tax=Mycolicibacterium alvei TaxID=67081 RepID=A0A6N4V219_9MYCO|nr:MULTISPECIES: DUF5131 family protein [Mycolicibacterium]MCV7003445.1 DUF5131 family protein [Mycolicibacterium alvei]OBG22039.1 hypothetical protein A5768_24590 [Mycolicibacterium fortuitum]BBX30608.1 hypothetical protein MALV_57330 [Mycolicibacterium alvei]